MPSRILTAGLVVLGLPLVYAACAPASRQAAAPQPPAPTTTPTSGVAYGLVAVASEKCVQAVGTAGAQISTCNDIAVQRFVFESVGSGSFRIRSEDSRMCLEPAEASTQAAQLLQAACSGAESQQWIVTDLGAGAVKLTARHSGLVMNVSGNSSSDGAAVIQYPASGSPNEQFRLMARGRAAAPSSASGTLAVKSALVPGARYRIEGLPSRKCVQAVGTAGAQISTCNDIAVQRFVFEAAASGSFSIRSEDSGMCLEPAKASTQTAQLLQAACSGAPSQQWIVTELGVGAVKLTARHSGLVMNVSGNSSSDGAAVIQYPATGSPNEQFKLVTVH